MPNELNCNLCVSIHKILVFAAKIEFHKYYSPVPQFEEICELARKLVSPQKSMGGRSMTR